MAAAHSSPELPPEIVFYNILPRLPAKSLLRFMCVSKVWQSSLTTPSFEKLHLHHATNDHHQNHHKLLAVSTSTPVVFHTIDCEAPENGLTAGRPFPFKGAEFMDILASSGGLVCVGIKKFNQQYSDLILWNPLTGDYKTLAKPHKSHNGCYAEYYVTFCLYYSSCDDDYKLIHVTNDAVAYIYSLRSNSWRKIDKTSTDYLKKLCRRSRRWCSTTVLSEKIYILYKFQSTERYLIIMFDSKTEMFAEISTPSFNYKKQNIFQVHFMVLGAGIHLYVNYGYKDGPRSVFIELWRMDGDGDGDWTKVKVGTNCPSSIIDQPPLHMMRNGDLLVHSDSQVYLSKVVLTSPISVKGVSWSKSTNISSRGKYIETLVSPNRNRSSDEVKEMRTQVDVLQREREDLQRKLTLVEEKIAKIMRQIRNNPENPPNDNNPQNNLVC